MADRRLDPSTCSSDHLAMREGWTLISDIRSGVRAIKAKHRKYLPQYEREDNKGYELRLHSAPWRPEFVDALRNLTSKPFTKKVTVNAEAPDLLQGVVDPATNKRRGGFVDDVDGAGNSLHVFSREMFTNGIASGVTAVLVDYPTMNPGATLADERSAGARPYWVPILAENILALHTKTIGGRLVVSHIRFCEELVEIDCFDEVAVKRIRVFELDDNNSPVWALWQMDPDTNTYVQIEEGTISLPEIPVALFFTGERSGVWRVKPPLIDLAHMQIELYQALSRNDEIEMYAGSPMLKVTGIQPDPTRQWTLGPKFVVELPPGDNVAPDADWIQPDAENITALRESYTAKRDDFRRLALQPTLPNSGTMTATGTAVEAAKSHSAIEAWANGFKDVLDQALKFTCQWYGIADTVTASVHTDFGIDILGVDQGTLLVTAANPANKIISRQTARQEMQRRGILGPDFDETEEEQRLTDEDTSLMPDPVDEAAALGQQQQQEPTDPELEAA